MARDKGPVERVVKSVFHRLGSKDEDMGAGSIGKTAGGKRTVPRIGLHRCPVGRQILGAEAGDKLADRFPVDLVTG